MSILRISLPVPASLSLAKTLSGSNVSVKSLSLATKFSHLSVAFPSSIPSRTTPIRMGCPRICPGGMTKMRWRRLQARKAKQLHEEGLVRERLLYKMRKRAELKAAVAELERPWESAGRLPNLLSGRANGQPEAEDTELSSPDDGEIEIITTLPEDFLGSGWRERTGPPLIGKSDDKIGLQRKRRYKKLRSEQSASDKGGNVSDCKSKALDSPKKLKVRNSRERLRRK